MSTAASTIRPAAVAGLFYPDRREILEREVGRLLAGADPAADARVPKALIAPHAGYSYSGAIAASAYALLPPARGTITRVILLGPTHRVPVRGLAVPSVSHFATPLAPVEIDRAAVARLARMPQVVVSDAAHALEHSLEVHLPFLQAALERFSLVPLAVGDATADEVAAVLDAVWGEAETLIVVSSDLSHYLGYEQALGRDHETARAILALESEIDHEQACGATPICGLTLAARTRGLEPRMLDLRNSGDTAGDRRRVVGYAAFAFYEGA